MVRLARIFHLLSNFFGRSTAGERRARLRASGVARCFSPRCEYLEWSERGLKHRATSWPAKREISGLVLALLAAAGAATFGRAQTAPAPSPILTAPVTEEKAPAPKRPRAVSGDVAAQLAAAMPKYTPPPPKPAPKPEEEQTDLRDVDKPKNTIIRLPKYVVQEPKPPVFSERAINTSKGLADIAMRRYISEVDRTLNRFTLPFIGMSMQQRALAMYAEDERLKNMGELADDANMVSATDKAAGVYVKREAQKTYMRASDFGWNGGGPK